MNTDEYGAFAAKAGLAAIERFELAIPTGDQQTASASLTEWLYWWWVAHEWCEKRGRDLVEPRLAEALKLARHASTHRAVTTGILHSARLGEFTLGVTRLGQDREMAWLSLERIPPGPGRPERQVAERDSYRALLAGRNVLEAAKRVQEWFGRLAEQNPQPKADDAHP